MSINNPGGGDIIDGGIIIVNPGDPGVSPTPPDPEPPTPVPSDDANVYRFDLQTRGWWPLKYAPLPTCIYLQEGEGQTSLLMGAQDGVTYEMGVGTTDNGIDIDGLVITPSYDFGDTRAQKMFLDYMIDAAPDGVTLSINPLMNNRLVELDPQTMDGTTRTQVPFPLADESLALYRNIALLIEWSSDATPVLYEFQPNALMQPFLAKNFSTQFISHGWTGFGHLRDGWLVYISGSDLTMEITPTDGQAQSPFSVTLPNSNGAIAKQYVVLPVLKGQMFRYNIFADTEFILFTDETIIRSKEWGSNGQFVPSRPFIGQTPGNMVAP